MQLLDLPSCRARHVTAVLATALVVGALGGPVDARAYSRGAHAATTSTSIGDHCLVGTWRDLSAAYLTHLGGYVVVMTGLGGAIEKDHSSGRSTVSWAHAHKAVGDLFGHRITERVRGSEVATLRAHPSTDRLSYRNVVAHHIVETFTYRGHTIHRRENGPRRHQVASYTCTALTFTTTPGGDASRVGS